MGSGLRNLGNEAEIHELTTLLAIIAIEAPTAAPRAGHRAAAASGFNPPK